MSESGTTDTDNSEKWEKDLDAELEGFSEFEVRVVQWLLALMQLPCIAMIPFC